MADEKQTTADETVEYEYVEAPDDGIEYEYIEVPEGTEPEMTDETTSADNIEYEYIEVPEEEAAPAPEAPAAEATEEVEYEYVEVPEEEAAPAPEAPAAEASEEVEYEYVEVPEEEAAPAPEAPAAEASEEVELPEEKEEPANGMSQISPLSAEEEDLPLDDEPPLPPDDEGPSTDILMEPEVSAPVDSEVPLPPEDDEAFPVANIADPVDQSLLENEEALVEELEIPEDEEEDNAQQETEPAPVSAEELEEIEEPAAQDEETPQAAQSEEEESLSPAPVVADVSADEIDAYAADAAMEMAKEAEEDNLPNPPETDEETQEELDPDDVDDTLSADDRFVYDGNEGIASFTGTPEKDTVVLNRENGKFNSLVDWHLIINELTVIPLNSQSEEDLPLSEDIFCQGRFVSSEKEISSFANVPSVKIPAVENGEQLNAVISGINVISLAGREGSVIDLDASSGMLIGPDEAKLYFSGLNKLVIPAPAEPKAPAYVIPEIQEDENAFVFTQTQAAAGEHAETQNPFIVIKTGYNLYGWNVVFENGMSMSLADVRSYQSKHRALPDKNGTISYGKSVLTFTGAEKITAYEKPSYCAYGLSAAV